MGPNFEFFGPKTQCGPNSDPCRVWFDSIWLPSSCRPCLVWRLFFVFRSILQRCAMLKSKLIRQTYCKIQTYRMDPLWNPNLQDGPIMKSKLIGWTNYGIPFLGYTFCEVSFYTGSFGARFSAKRLTKRKRTLYKMSLHNSTRRNVAYHEAIQQ